MKIQNLKTLIVVSEHRTFVAAGRAIGLSHSAVSLHMKALEEELGVPLFDRRIRPPVLTDRGLQLVDHARRLTAILDNITSLSSSETLVGSLVVGVVQSALINLLPPALASVKAKHPRLKIILKTGLSRDLAQRVRRQEIDVAIIANPGKPLEDLTANVVCIEPLFVLAPRHIRETEPRDILTSHPYIWYDRNTWGGSQIQQYLLAENVHVKDGIEVDSLEAIEQLVRFGLGVSVAPKTTCGDDDFCDEIRVVPFGEPQKTRTLIMVERDNNPRKHLAAGLLSELRAPRPEVLPSYKERTTD